MHKRLSYANVMATLAVFIALGGGAWAVAIGKNDVGSREIAKNAVGTGELKNNKATGKDIDESSLAQVPSAKSADSANSADTANSATTANTANSATTADTANSATTADSATTAGTADIADPRLYAHVEANGTVDVARSRGIASTNITHDPNSGSYCISGLSFTPKTVVGGVDSKAGSGRGHFQASTVPANFGFCPAGTQIELVTYEHAPDNFHDFPGGFYIWVN